MKVIRYDREGDGKFAWYCGAHLIEFRTTVLGKYKDLWSSLNGPAGSVNIARDILFDGIDSLVRAYFLPEKFHDLSIRKVNGNAYYKVDNTHAWFSCQDFPNPDERRSKEIRLRNDQCDLRLQLKSPSVSFLKALFTSEGSFIGDVKLIGYVRPEGHYSVSTDIAYLFKDIAEKIPDQVELTDYSDYCMFEDLDKTIKAMLFQRSAGTQVRVEGVSDRFREMEDEYVQVRRSILEHNNTEENRK